MEYNCIVKEILAGHRGKPISQCNGHGKFLAEDQPEKIAKSKKSYTGQYLKDYLGK